MLKEKKSRYVNGLSKADFLRSVARMYYILGMNQQDIAKKLDIGRSSVARFLAEARDSGIVQIRIDSPVEDERNFSLEEELRGRYKLKDAIITNDLPSLYYSLAAAYISSVIPHTGIVALSGGRTMMSIGQYLSPSTPNPDLHFVQTTGIISEAVPSIAAVQTWAERFNAKALYLSAPGILSSTDGKRVFLDDPSVHTAYQALRKADMSVTGIGTMNASLFSSGNPLISFQNTLSEDCVGDICLHFFDSNGDFRVPELSNSVLGIPVVDFLRIPIRIGVAVGEDKVKAIRGALCGRLINVIITNESTAKALL